MPRTAPDPHAAATTARPEDGLYRRAEATLGDHAAREALHQALALLDEAERRQAPAALCHALAETARALAGLRAYAAAEHNLAQAQRWALAMGATDLRADLACAAAELAADAADQARVRASEDGDERRARDRARDQAFEAARLAGQTADPHWEVKVLLRASDVLDRCGDHDDAVQMQQRALVLMGLHDVEAGDPDTASTRLAAPGRLM